MREIWFWQRIVSPHMVGLAVSLAGRGCDVTYVVEQEMSSERQSQGWNVPDCKGLRLRVARDKATALEFARSASANSIHLCQGIRSNGHIASVQELLAKRGVSQWVVMEQVDDRGFSGLLKRLEYARLFRTRGRQIQGVLAAGASTVGWVVSRGMPSKYVFPFAYFLPDVVAPPPGSMGMSNRFSFIFVGQFIERKRLSLLIAGLRGLMPAYDFDLIVVGSGPLESRLREEAEAALPGRVRWIGRLASTDVPHVLAQSDCLVLPSHHDGWGAVVSEALLVGTTVVCSDACGAAVAVHASGAGGVFQRDHGSALNRLLEDRLQAGRLSDDQRHQLADWAKCLGADAGADYLLEILAHCEGTMERPLPPWILRESK